MADYNGTNGPVVTSDQTVRVFGGASVGGTSGTALNWVSASGSMTVWGTVWGSTAIAAIQQSANRSLAIEGSGSVSGAIVACLTSFTNFGRVGGAVRFSQNSGRAVDIQNFGSVVTNGTDAAMRIDTGSTLNNLGMIAAAGPAIEYVSGDHLLTNYSTIASLGQNNVTAIRLTVAGTQLILTNNGAITAGSEFAGAIETLDRADTITNNGSIVGTIKLGAGIDTYLGEYGRLAGRLSMGEGADIAFGGGENNRIDGDGGNDTLFGNGGSDRLDGGAGTDFLNGGEGDDLLTGGMENDSLNGGTGADDLSGGTGDDSYYVDNVFDIVRETANGGVDVVYASTNYTLRAGQEIEELRVDPNSPLTGIALTGNSFAQTIVGDVGNNRITGGGGADRMEGLAGDDTYIISTEQALVVEAVDAGYDTVRLIVERRDSGATIYLLPDNVEAVVLVTTDIISPFLGGNALDNQIVGNASNDVIDGRGGADRMIGGAGDDLYFVDNVGDVVSDSAGFDSILSTVSYTLPAGVEELELGTGSGPLTATGNGFANTLVSNSSSDVLAGRGGADVLTGNGGSDTFLFETPARADWRDRITDFETGVDRIALDDAVFKRIGGLGTLDARYFTDGPATTADHRILFDAATGALSYDADGSGTNASAVVIATVQQGAVVTVADIVVV